MRTVILKMCQTAYYLTLPRLKVHGALGELGQWGASYEVITRTKEEIG